MGLVEVLIENMKWLYTQTSFLCNVHASQLLVILRTGSSLVDDSPDIRRNKVFSGEVERQTTGP